MTEKLVYSRLFSNEGVFLDNKKMSLRFYCSHSFSLSDDAYIEAAKKLSKSARISVKIFENNERIIISYTSKSVFFDEAAQSLFELLSRESSRYKIDVDCTYSPYFYINFERIKM